jgi:hypothetical protein
MKQNAFVSRVQKPEARNEKQEVCHRSEVKKMQTKWRDSASRNSLRYKLL